MNAASQPSLPATVEIFPVEGEPRVRDIDLAQRLGFDRPRDIRKLIERNRAELESFGTCATVARVVKGARGSTEATEYWLNEEQGLLVATLSKTDLAAAVRAMLIKVFVAYRRGHLAPTSGSNANARETRLQFNQHLATAKLLGLTGNQAVLAASRVTKAAVGFDVLAEMGVTHIVAPQNDYLINVTTIGQRLGGLSAIAVNNMLASAGLQIGATDDKGRKHWRPTPAGERLGAVMTDVNRTNGTGTARQLLWSSSIVDHLRNLNGEG